MLAQALTFLADNVIAFFVILLLARFHFQWLRIGFRNPVGEFVIAATNWIVVPARRLIPGVAGLDLATLVSGWLLQALGVWIHTSLVGPDMSAVAVVAVALVHLMRYSIYILMFAVFIQVVLSWVNPYAPVAPVFNALTQPFLKPFRRYIPPVGGVDLSPFVLFLILGALLYPVEALTRALSTL